jgi:signal transduction histidine kinase
MKDNIQPNKLTNKLFQSLGFELRTLLNGFSGPIQLLKATISNPELTDVFRMFDSSLSRLERLAIRSALVTKMELEEYQFELKQENIIDIARYSAIELQSISNLESIKILIAQEPSSIMVEGNFDLLKSLFEILLESAISLSAENSSIEITFITLPDAIKCNIVPSNASLPYELNSSADELHRIASTPWDLLLAKSIALIHNVQLVIVNPNSQLNFFELIFKKPMG